MLRQLSETYYLFYNFFLKYPTPNNLGYFWNFGIASLLFLFIQLVTGVFLSMNYVANAELAFISVENIMRNINLGWLLRYMHLNGASFFFICVYLHTFRNLYFFSFLRPRQNVWNVGVLILLLMILTAFTGYVLPWGQMSFWAATVITNLASAVPFFGDFIVIWLWGGYSINTFTLNRFFSLHYLLPFLILALVAIHIIFLHSEGSSNKLNPTFKLDKLMFHPYFTTKDVNFLLILLFIFFSFVGFFPNYLGHPDNYIPADPLVTPAHIVPEWYFLPFYAMLRSIPSKSFGVVILLLSILILLVFPIFFNYKNLFSNKPVVPADYGGKFPLEGTQTFYSFFFWCFVVICIFLGILGGKPMDFPYLVFGRLFTFAYFSYFVIIVLYHNKVFSKFSNFFSPLYSKKK